MTSSQGNSTPPSGFVFKLYLLLYMQFKRYLIFAAHSLQGWSRIIAYSESLSLLAADLSKVLPLSQGTCII